MSNSCSFILTTKFTLAEPTSLLDGSLDKPRICKVADEPFARVESFNSTLDTKSGELPAVYSISATLKISVLAEAPVLFVCISNL